MLREMPAENIKELLSRLSVANLQQMDEALDRQVEDLKTEKAWIAEAMTKKGVTPKSPRSEQAPKKTPRKAKGGRSTGSAAAIKQIFEDQPDRVLMPAEVIDAVLAKGISSTPNSIRVALRRFGEKGFLERGPDGDGWTRAKSNGSPQGTFDGSETSTPKAVEA